MTFDAQRFAIVHLISLWLRRRLDPLLPSGIVVFQLFPPRPPRKDSPLWPGNHSGKQGAASFEVRRQNECRKILWPSSPSFGLCPRQQGPATLARRRACFCWRSWGRVDIPRRSAVVASVEGGLGIVSWKIKSSFIGQFSKARRQRNYYGSVLKNPCLV